jgi:hypothetical protein
VVKVGCHCEYEWNLADIVDYKFERGSIMEDREQFNKNLERWALNSPKEVELLLQKGPLKVEFCTTGSGDLNLKKVEEGQIYYYHSTQNALEEAQQWFSSLDLYNISTLFVYGVGLGYYYHAAKEWLKANKRTHLVFVEDDSDVIVQLFQTETGTELLHDNQVTLLLINLSQDEEPQDVEKRFFSLPYTLLLGNIRLSALHLYSQIHASSVFLLNLQLEYLKNVKIYQVMEYMRFGEAFFHNFYRNLLELSKAYLGDKLYGKFNGIPAIICGAGPSLDNSLPLLKELKDRALIFAGGSAMNAINTFDVLPHFGVGIDPNLGQYVRLMMNQAYEIPFFYRNRIFPEALQSIHGPRLFILGTGGHPISKWIEEQFGVKESTSVSEGYNVTNFSLSLANALGCNPIILVGVDLAFTHKNAYATGVHPHPLYDMNQSLQSKGMSDEVIYRPDIYGKPVPTLWKWGEESAWCSQFLKAHPSQMIINSTEGGIGFEGIVNMPLREVVKKYLSKSFDFSAWVHGEICCSNLPNSITKESVVNVMKKMEKSLENSFRLCSELKIEFEEVGRRIKTEKDFLHSQITEKALWLLKNLNQEPAFNYILNKFNDSFLEYFGQRAFFQYSDQQENSKQIDVAFKRAQINRKRYEFLKAVCKVNLQHLKKTLEEQKIRDIVENAFQKLSETEEIPSEKSFSNDTYTIEKGRMKIIDQEMDIFIDAPINMNELTNESFPRDGKLTFYYPDGNIKLVQFYLLGVLHGPSTFYGNDGKVLASSWYVNGYKQGKMWNYYSSGNLHSLQRYRDGVFDGKQEFYYKDEKLKSILEYKKGKLNGKVILYYSNREKKRELHFVDGKKNGKEHFWNVGGILELEINWNSDCPIGACCAWYGNGKLAREIIYDKDSKPCSVKAWTSEGILLPAETLFRVDYFDSVSKQAHVLTNSLENIFNQLYSMSPQIQMALQKISEPSFDIDNDLAQLKEEIENLKKISEKVKVQSEATSSDTKEALWKTPESQRLLGKQIQETTKEMAQNIKAAQEALKLTLDILGKTKKSQSTKDGTDSVL